VTRATGLSRGLLALGAALSALSLIGAVALWREEHTTVWIIALIQAAVYAFAGFLVLWRSARAAPTAGRTLAPILFVALVMRLPLLPSQPVSTDLWRYIWDGRVQAAGINPYLHVPNDPALQHLRDDTVFDQINRFDYAPTIYPPTAQIVFFLVTRLSESAVVMKAAMVAFEGVAVWALLQLLAARGLPPSRLIFYAWHPLTAWEFAGSAHVDIVAIAFMLLAFVAADRRSPFLAGAALAAGTFVKYVPIVTGPAIYRRWDWRLPLAFLLTAVVLYAPYVGAGAKVIGFLPGYIAEEGLARGHGFYLWSVLAQFVSVPQDAFGLYLPAAALALLVLALILFTRRTHDGCDLAAAMILAVTAVVLISPHYPWYFAWLVPFLCVHPVAAVVYLTGASTYLYSASWPPTVLEATVLYGPFFLLVFGEALWRRLPPRTISDERAVPA
jgi:alpha-1,6-mannosyltransferase